MANISIISNPVPPQLSIFNKSDDNCTSSCCDSDITPGDVTKGKYLLDSHANFSAKQVEKERVNISHPPFKGFSTKYKKKKQEKKPKVSKYLRQISRDLQEASIMALMKSGKFTKDFTAYPRIYHCGRTVINKNTTPSLVKGESGKYFFSGLQRCGSYWVCPSCALKIAKHKEKGIYQAVNEYKEFGYNIHFLTLTFPHYMHDNLKDILTFLIKGFDYLNNHRQTRKSLKFRFIRAVEPTFGGNGWHPHLHVVIISKHSSEELRRVLRPLWQRRIKKQLNREGNDNAFNLVSWDSKRDALAKYLTKIGARIGTKRGSNTTMKDVEKWTLAKELVRGHIKQSNKGYTPFDMLHIIATGEAPEFDFDPVAKFKEFAEAFRGRQAFTFSRNFLKDIEEATRNLLEKEDAEIVRDEKVDQVMVSFDYKAWKTIIQDKLHTEIMNVCEDGGMRSVLKLISDRYGGYKRKGHTIFLNST